MSNKTMPSEENGRRIVHVERQGRVKYTYYDDGIVKITRYKAKKKIYWGRIFAAIIVAVLLIMGLAQLAKATANAIKGSATGGESSRADTSKQFVFDSSSNTADEQAADTAESMKADADTEVESQDEDESSSLADSEAEDKSLTATYSNMSLTVCIDPGHGDYDKGTVEGDGIVESEQNLEISLLVRDYLEACGVSVIMTRDTDEQVSLSDRCSAANQASADFFVSLHRNSVSGDTDYSGVEIWVNNNEPEYDVKLAENILSGLETVGITQNLGVKYGYSGLPDQNYQVNMDTVMPSCLVELGFVTNASDNALFESNKEDYAKAIGDAVIKTAIELSVVDESGERLLNEQLLSDGKNNVTVN